MDSTTQKLLSRHSRRKKKCSTGIQTRVSSTGPFCDSPPLVVLTASDAFSYKNERAPTCSKSKRQQKEGEKDDMMEGSALLSLAKAEAEGRDIFGARDVQRKTTFHPPTPTMCVCTGTQQHPHQRTDMLFTGCGPHCHVVFVVRPEHAFSRYPIC